jgi:DNA-binding MarR family transcriptional regulator
MDLQNSSCKEFKALSNQLRLLMLPHLETPRTVKQVADEMNMKPHTLYHHVRVLEKCGVVKLVRTTKLKGSIEENYFQLTDKFKRHVKTHKFALPAESDALDLTMSIIKEYRDCISTHPDLPCHNCVNRVTVSSKDSGKIRRSLKTGVEKLFEEHLKPYSTPDGDATFVLNTFGFLK